MSTDTPTNTPTHESPKGAEAGSRLIPAPVASYLRALGRKDPSSKDATPKDHSVFAQEIGYRMKVTPEVVYRFMHNLESAGAPVVSHINAVLGDAPAAATEEAPEQQQEPEQEPEQQQEPEQEPEQQQEQEPEQEAHAAEDNAEGSAEGSAE